MDLDVHGESCLYHTQGMACRIGMSGFTVAHMLLASLADWQVVDGFCIYPRSSATVRHRERGRSGWPFNIGLTGRSPQEVIIERATQYAIRKLGVSCWSLQSPPRVIDI